jgi:hypothetical protein
MTLKITIRLKSNLNTNFKIHIRTQIQLLASITQNVL